MAQYWRRHAEPVSLADEDVLIEMCNRGYGIHLEDHFDIEFNPEEDRVHGTEIDLFWHHPYSHAVFLDGRQVHWTDHQADIDEKVTEALERRGITVQREVYDPPLTPREKKRICEEIEKELEKAFLKHHLDCYGDFERSLFICHNDDCPLMEQCLSLTVEKVAELGAELRRKEGGFEG